MKGPTYASSKSLTLKTSRPWEFMYVPKFSACRSPWIHTRLRVLVEERAVVLLALQVGVEERGGAAVEGEGGGRHLPELHPERGRVGGEELAERGVEDGEDLLAALLSTGSAGPTSLGASWYGGGA